MTGPIVDTNVYLSRWPTRRVPLDETAKLVEKLNSQGVVEAWVGSFDALLHKDMASLNTRLVEECAEHKDVRLVPFGSVNPKLPDWEEDVRRCAELHNMPGIRLHPNYHGYTLEDPEFGAVVKAATARNMIVQLAIIMEDDRMMHPMFRATAVDPRPLLKVVRETPGLKLELLNAAKNVKGELLADLTMAGDVYVEIAQQEGVNGVETLLRSAPLERVLFGSFSPAFYFEAAQLKLQESPLAGPQVKAICEENARRLLPRS
jgi:predicted TIM-barrel fold metal-dependent hydrolase